MTHPPCDQLWAGGTTQPVPLGHQRRAVGSDRAAAAGGEDRRPAGEVSRCALVDAIVYVVRTGCAWRQLPADFPPWQTVYWYFNRWEQYKVTEQILPVVRAQLRIAEGRNPQPSAGLIDSQTVKGADTVGRESRGQNVAIGLTGLPDVPAKRTGATARWKSHWPSSAAVVAHTSRSQLSSSHRPIATRLTA